MSKILFAGSKQKLFEIAPSRNLYNEHSELNPYLAKQYIVRSPFESGITEDEYGIAWDCDTGIFIYGATPKIEKLFEQLRTLLATTLDEPEQDLENIGTPSSLALFTSPTKDISFIIGHGSYVDLDATMQQTIESIDDVYYIVANNDKHPIYCLEEFAGYCDLDDPYYQEILTEINEHHNN